MKTILAFDPGANGGYAYTSANEIYQGNIEEFKVVDVVRALAPNCVAYMEQVGGYVGDEDKAPGSRMFNFGDGYGFIRGACACAGIKLHLIPPQRWMRAVLPGVIGMQYNERKRALKQFAQQLNPTLDVTLKTADALCLLEYARRIEQGGERSVVIPHRKEFSDDAKQATKWAKECGYSVPTRGSRDFIDMVNYWRKHKKSP